MDFAKVSVEVRTATGKGNARRVRKAGKVPGVLYGHKAAPIALALDPSALVKSLDKQRKRNTVFSLSVTGDGAASEELLAMIRDADIDPLSRRLLHVDFIRVSLEEEVRVTVPLVLKGTAVGVVNGGQLHQSIHELAIAARPQAIPARLEVDVSGLNLGSALHVSDIQLPEGVRAVVEAKEAIASVVAPRAEKETAPVAAEAAAEGAAAAPAAGDKKDAAKPAAGGDKKDAGGEKKGK